MEGIKAASNIFVVETFLKVEKSDSQPLSYQDKEEFFFLICLKLLARDTIIAILYVECHITMVIET